MAKNFIKLYFIFWIFMFVVLTCVSIFSVLAESYDEGTLQNPFDYCRITDVDYTGVIYDDPEQKGTMSVKERLTFDIHAASIDNPFYELYRDLVEDNVDGVDVKYTVKAVRQILPDGRSIEFDESPKLYWYDSDYVSSYYGPRKWFHSPGPYNEYLRNYECVLFYVDGLYREKPTYEVEYDMHNAVLRYNDCSELYISMYSGDTIKYLKSFHGQILIPDEIMPKQGNYDAHTYGTSANNFNLTESDTLNRGFHTFDMNLTEKDLKFNPYNKYLEFTLLSYNDDKAIFSQNASINDYYFDDVLDECFDEQREYDAMPSVFFIIKAIICALLVFISYVIIKGTMKLKEKINSKYTFFEPEIAYDYFREIPSNLDPNFAAEFVFSKHKRRSEDDIEFSALMLDMVRKKYLELDRIDPNKGWDFNNINIIIKHRKETTVSSILTDGNDSINDPLGSSNIYNFKTHEAIDKFEPLTPAEDLYYNLIVKYAGFNDAITLHRFQSLLHDDYLNTENFISSISKTVTNIGVNEGYFQKLDYKEPQKHLNDVSISYYVLAIFTLLGALITRFTRLDYCFGGIFIFAGASLYAAYKNGSYAKGKLLFTQFGETEYAKWRGLYNFLNSDTLMNEKTVIDLPLWEQYLVYATAFGISEKVLKAIEIRCPDFDKYSNLNNSYYRSRSFHVHHTSIRSTAHSAHSAARSGGYGGYGGGGRGGGGGGGGH